MRLDLGKSSFLNKLSIFWHKDSGSTNYGLQGSNDARRWKKLSANLSSSQGTTNPHLKEHGLSGSYRYLRLLIFKAQKDSPIIYELRVLGQISALDITPPTGSIRINNNASYANSTSIVLSLSARDNPGGSGLFQMQFSNDGISWSAPEAYATTKSWSLSPGDGQKIVSVKFKDNAGNWSQVYSDTITLDTTPPQITSTVPQEYFTFYENDSIGISASVQDNDPSLLEYQFSIDNLIKQPWSAQTNYDWSATSGRHSLKIEVRDEGGQTSKEVEVYVYRIPVGLPLT